MKFLYNISLVLISLSILSCSEDKAVVEDYTKKEEKVETTGGVFLTQKEAAVIARKFIKVHGILGPQTKSKSFGLDMVYTDVGNEVKTKSAVKPAYYVFNIDDSGFIIVSSSKATLPILGYSTESKFSGDQIPVNLSSVLEGFKSQISKIRKKNKPVTEVTKNARQSCLNADVIKTKSDGSVAPLLGGIKWGQRPYYNAYCPDNTSLGCVATAAAQIMRYYEYPKSSTGSFWYKDKNYGDLSFNYDYVINWSAMPKQKLTRNNDEVAKFCYGIAVGLEMEFAQYGGSAAHQSSVVDLAVEHYGYSKDIRQIYRLSYKNNLRKWEDIIKKELRASRPVQYSGDNGELGHSFVCDGYDENTGFFHFNWGWGGISNGYFLLSNLNPDNVYGEEQDFNRYHKAIIGFAPPKGGSNRHNSDTSSAGNYCLSKSTTASYCYIKEVVLGKMKNRTTAGRGYSNYSNKEAYARAGKKLNFKITPGFSKDRYKMYCNVWIDYNKDNKFSNSEAENVIHYSSSKSGDDYIYIPKNIEKGSYRVRISMKYDDYAKPCESFEYGEVEDYTLVVY